MFGYVKACPPQLRLCEWEAYRGVYCGLCRTLGRRFGPFARLCSLWRWGRRHRRFGGAAAGSTRCTAASTARKMPRCR